MRRNPPPSIQSIRGLPVIEINKLAQTALLEDKINRENMSQATIEQLKKLNEVFQKQELKNAEALETEKKTLEEANWDSERIQRKLAVSKRAQEALISLYKSQIEEGKKKLQMLQRQPKVIFQTDNFVILTVSNNCKLTHPSN